MRSIIQFDIQKGDKYYVASGIGLSIVTQAKTLDELSKNIKEAVELHLENESFSDLGITKNPSILVNFELMPNLCLN
jgi:predicted RNase H-like HicB family nuclease